MVTIERVTFFVFKLGMFIDRSRLNLCPTHNQSDQISEKFPTPSLTDKALESDWLSSCRVVIGLSWSQEGGDLAKTR